MHVLLISKKAYDSVWNDGLVFKLENMQINDPFLHLIGDIYSKSSCAVKIRKQVHKVFRYNKGLWQGCPQNPNLFNLYVNDLFLTIDEANPNPLSLDKNDGPISALIYADDLIILSTSHQGLQKCLDALQKYCEKWKLQANTMHEVL